MKKISYILYIFILCIFCVHCNAKNNIVTHVTLTTYHPVVRECNNDPLHTSDMSVIDLKKLKKGQLRWVAISRDLLWLIPMGSKIHIDGYGWFEVHDLMNKRYNHCIDILIHPSSNKTFKEEKVKVTR